MCCTVLCCALGGKAILPVSIRFTDVLYCMYCPVQLSPAHYSTPLPCTARTVQFAHATHSAGQCGGSEHTLSLLSLLIDDSSTLRIFRCLSINQSLFPRSLATPSIRPSQSAIDVDLPPYNTLFATHARRPFPLFQSLNFRPPPPGHALSCHTFPTTAWVPRQSCRLERPLLAWEGGTGSDAALRHLLGTWARHCILSYSRHEMRRDTTTQAQRNASDAGAARWGGGDRRRRHREKVLGLCCAGLYSCRSAPAENRY